MSSQYESKTLNRLVQRSPAALLAVGVLFALAGAAAVILPGGSSSPPRSAEFVNVAGWAGIVIGVLAAIVAVIRMTSGRSGG